MFTLKTNPIPADFKRQFDILFHKENEKLTVFNKPLTDELSVELFLENFYSKLSRYDFVGDFFVNKRFRFAIFKLNSFGEMTNYNRKVKHFIIR